MKRALNTIALMFLLAPLGAFAHENEDYEHSHLYEHIHTEQLKKMRDAGESLVLIDARTKPQDDKNRIPGAKSLPFNSPDTMISTLIPSKEMMVVVYCINSRCHESGFLAERLATLGYKHVYRYQDGINDWIQHGYTVEQAK